MITAMNHLTLGVKDVEKSFVFYRDILNLKPLVKWDKGAYFLVGNRDINVTCSHFWFCIVTDEKRIPNPCATHYAFSVGENDFDVLEKKIIASGAVVYKNNDTPGKSLYFLDPDEHKLEIHIGTPEMRIACKKTDLGSWKNVKWFV